VPELRPLAEADREAWRSLRFALWPRDDDGSFDADISEILASGGRLAAYGAFEAGRLVGFIEVGERLSGEGCDTAPVGWVEGIYVEPRHRRSAIGGALIAAAEAWARGRGYHELGSDVEAANAVSLHSHAAWGFEETKRLVMFRKRL
jgi:aminoglycoside 6'-N-acetyltransferase I